MNRRLVFLALGFLLAACSSAPPPEAPAEPAMTEQTMPALPTEEVVTATVRVTASSLNVRDQPTTEGEKIDAVRRGQRLGLVREEDGWSRVRLTDGRLGWVSSRYVRKDTKCPPDQDFTFNRPPRPAFSDSDAHGVVSVEVTVDARGTVMSTKLLSNTTGDEALGKMTEEEIRSAGFSPPIRNCRPLPFIYVYRRTF